MNSANRLQHFKFRTSFKIATTALAVVIFSGCASTPVPPIDTSQYSTPTKGMAGIYFYQLKTGIIGAGSDVKFILDDKIFGKINTGEWLYFEENPGIHKYRFIGGPFPSFVPIEFKEGQNYFFRGFLSSGMDHVVWINNKEAIDSAFENIKSGRYEKGDVD
jgi:hypothetical protein